MDGYENIKKILQQLSIKGEDIKFVNTSDTSSKITSKISCYYNDTNEINIKDIFTRLKEIQNACIPQGSDITNLDEYKKVNKIRNQILRIKDSRITASKNTALLLVGAPTYKHKMIKETIDLAKNIYDLTNINLAS